MALSFGDSVGKIKNSTLKPTAAIAEVFSDIREENFTKSDKYENQSHSVLQMGRHLRSTILFRSQNLPQKAQHTFYYHSHWQ